MSEKQNGFTISTLEQLSGFDRRTIAYYVQEGLLPKVGRRGPGTVYPAAFKQRLMFIRAVRDLQDAGILRAVTLAETRELLLNTDTAELQRLQLLGQDSDNAIRALFNDPDWDTSGLAVAVEEVLQADSGSLPIVKTDGGLYKNGVSTKSLSDRPGKPKSSASIGQLIDEIESAAHRSQNQANTSGDSLTFQTSVKLSPRITITVDGLENAESKLFKSLVDALRNLD